MSNNSTSGGAAPPLPTLVTLAQALIGAVVTVSLTSGAQLRGTLEQCVGGQFELVLVGVAETSASGAMTSRSRVQVSGEQVLGIEFARTVDVHRLMRTKEKRAMGQRRDKTKRMRVPEVDVRQEARHETIVVPDVAEPRRLNVAERD